MTERAGVTSLEGKTPKLKIAAGDNVNLGLCDSRDYANRLNLALSFVEESYALAKNISVVLSC